MITTTIATSIRKLSLALRTAFASKSPKDHPSRQEVLVTKFNPKRQMDLRGFEHFDKMSENEKSYSPIHSTQFDPLSSYGLFGLLPNRVARWIGECFAHPRSAIASDCLHLPRISENGVPIYDSVDKGSTYLAANKLISIISPSSILLFSPEPCLALLTYGLLYYVYYSTNWKSVRHLVLKCELIPQTEEIAYQKLTPWGAIATKRVKISQLEYTPFSELFGENSLNEKSVRGLYNREVAFRIKDTKQILLFDKHGIWSKEGISHELLL